MPAWYISTRAFALFFLGGGIAHWWWLQNDSLKTRYLKDNIFRSGSKTWAVISTVIALALLIILMPSGPDRLLRLGLQQLVLGVLYATSHQLLELPPDYFLISLYILLWHGLCLLSEWYVVISFYQRSANHALFVHFIICETYFILFTCLLSTAFFSEVAFLAICKTSCVVRLFCTTQEVYTYFEVVVVNQILCISRIVSTMHILLKNTQT